MDAITEMVVLAIVPQGCSYNSLLWRRREPLYLILQDWETGCMPQIFKEHLDYLVDVDTSGESPLEASSHSRDIQKASIRNYRPQS